MDDESEYERRFEQLRKAYVERNRLRIERATAWVEQARHDKAVVRKLHKMAHELAGSGTTYGFPEISGHAASLERRLEPLVRDDLVLPDVQFAAEVEALIGALYAEFPT